MDQEEDVRRSNRPPRRRGRYRDDRARGPRRNESSGEQPRRVFGRGNRLDRKSRDDKEGMTVSPPRPAVSPRVVLMRPQGKSVDEGGQQTTSGTTTPGKQQHGHQQPGSSSASRSQSPLSQPIDSLSQGLSQGHGSTPDTPSSIHTAAIQQKAASLEATDYTKEVVKFLDPKTWAINESDVILHLLQDTNLSLSTVFKVVSVIGLPCSGKSRVMNLFTRSNNPGKEKQDDFFPCHKSSKSDGRNLLQHITSGVDMHITRERLVLLDSQPILSPSILDDYINSSIPLSLNGVPEMELIFATSLQVTSLLLSISDCIVVTTDWTLDPLFIKLLCSAIGTSMGTIIGNRQLNIIWYLSKPLKSTDLKDLTDCLQTIFGRSTITVVNGNEDDLVKTVLRVNTGREGVTMTTDSKTAPPLTEKSWLKMTVAYWDKLTKKSTLPSEFSRLTIK